MTHTTNRIVLAAVAIGLLILGLFAGNWWAHRGRSDMLASDSMTAGVGEREVLYWYDPMVPDQRFDEPGKSPFMDMELVPKYAGGTADGGVRIDPGLQQSVGVRTEKVEVNRLAVTVRVPGTLAWDLRRESVISAVTEGIVTKVHVKAPYARVVRGQSLATLLAPEWSSALAEAHALRDAQSEQARALQTAAQQRLRVLGVPRGGLGRDGGVTLSAPHDGVITEVLAREGQTVMPGAPLFRVNGTATVWLEAAIPQAQVGQLQAGTPVEATLSAIPGTTFLGEIDALLPQVDIASRTQQARIVLHNPDGVLAPGMFAEVTLLPEDSVPLPLVPTQALIATGTQSRVIVQGPEGGFRPVQVRVGRSSGGYTEILEGLEGGESVVVSGQFLIDSEASLSGLLERLETTPAQKAPEAPNLHEAEATIEALENGKVTLRHGPFRTLNMPGMTMMFPLADPDVAKGFVIGSRVRVFVRADDAGLTVQRLEEIDERAGEQP